MIAVMHLLTRRAFAAAFEWRRLVQLALVLGGMAAAGDLLLPTHGVVGFITRAAVLAAMPGGAARHRVRAPAGARAGALAAERGHAEDGA